MLEVHARLRESPQERERRSDPAGRRRPARGVRVLAFDEMVVNNSADAMIMSRLFTALIESTA
jgi:cell division protein ZapE